MGWEEVHRYIIREIQEIYASQGEGINDKHIEVIIRQMFSRIVMIDTRRHAHSLAATSWKKMNLRKQIGKSEAGGKDQAKGERTASWDHQSGSFHRKLPFSRVFPGNGPRSHQRRGGRQRRQAPRPQRKCHHRKTDSGRNRIQK